MIGLGYYDTFTPSVIARNVLENPSWYTAYTPYQPEISQGRLEALINFQTMVTDLTGLATANASMLDESTAVVEGMLRRPPRLEVDVERLPRRCRRPAADQGACCAHRAAAVGIELVELDFARRRPPPPDSSCSAPSCSTPAHRGGCGIRPESIAAVHGAGGLVVVAADLLALTLLRSPGSLGADVAVGTTQRFGVPLGFGGPHAGYMAVRAGLERQLPGRLVGVSQDAVGHPAYRLSLQTREQHIRREKATSNICTAQVLLAVMAAMYAVYHGPDGLQGDRDRRRAQGRGAGRAAALVRPVARVRRVLRHDPGDHPRAVRARDRARARLAGTSCSGSTTRRSASRSTRRRPPTTWPPSRWAFGLPAADEHGDRSVDVRGCRAAAPVSATRCCAMTTTSRIRCSTRTAARRR